MMKTAHQIAQCLTLMLPQNEALRPKPIMITLIATSVEVSLGPFATALTEACARIGSTKRINLSLIRQTQSHSFAACDDQQWIDVQSHGRRFVIFQTHPQAQAWTELGVQRADIVLLVGKFGASPAQGRIERLTQHLLAEQTNTRVELVLLSDGETTQLTSGSPWLAGRRVTAHHYVNLKVQRDLDRLVSSFTRSDNETPQSINSGNWHWDTDSLARVYA